MLSKSLVSLLLNAIPFFITNVRCRHRFWCRGQSMKQFLLGYFKTYLLLKKTCGDFGVLGITRLLDLFGRVLIPGDGKQMRVQFCSETFLLRHLLTLKHSHHFNFCLEFHDPFLLCSLEFTLINLDCLPVTISSSFFLPTVYEALLIFFPIFSLFICFRHLSLWLSPSLLLDSVSSYSTSSSAFNSLCLSRFSYCWSMHLCCLFLFFSFPHRACNYVPVRGMMSWMTQYTVSAPTFGKLLSNCPKWAHKTMKCIRYSVQLPSDQDEYIWLCTGHTLKFELCD